jgi:ribose 5-phosphate isomerase A
MMIAKQIAGEKAAEFVKNNMIIGLGTGSTVTYTIKKIGEMVKNGLQIKAVSTSSMTSELARSLNIPLLSIDDVESIDLTIDGADEVNPQFHGIKGGGGALLFEKIVAKASKHNIWVVDPSKMVQYLGKFPVPVEVVPFGYRHVINTLEKAGFKPELRIRDNKIYKTDSDNYIVDLRISQIDNPIELEKELKLISGVVENGLFINIVKTVIVGDEKGQIQIVEKP